MNAQNWQLYKESERGKRMIDMFDPEKEDNILAALDILKESVKWGGVAPDMQEFIDDFNQICWNFTASGLMPEEWTRDAFVHLIDEYEIRDAGVTDTGEIHIYGVRTQLPKEMYRVKAVWTQIISLALYYSFEFFKPVLLPMRFDVIQRNCRAVEIELPPIPRTNDYKQYCYYYYDICEVLNAFQKENGMTDAELCACIYDYALTLIDNEDLPDLPEPTNVWLVGADKGDFTFLDSLGKEKDGNDINVWQCNERTKRGDIVVVYCRTPRSYIHSIWRANSQGIFNPFDYYHCRTTVTDGILTPPIRLNDLKADVHFSTVPIVRKNMQGVNGVELTAKDYSELMRLIEERGGRRSEYPQLFVSEVVDFREISLEKDVENKILIPTLEKLGYSPNDWTRQLPQKFGRKEKGIPDFVFFPRGDKEFETAPFVIEAKLDFKSMRQFQKDFGQARSYAQHLHSKLFGICDKERLLIYNASQPDINKPIFESQWTVIWGNPVTGGNLKRVIGREVINVL